jgi:hypothetical protein
VPRPLTVTYAVRCLSASLLVGAGILAFAWEFPEIALVVVLVIAFLIFQCYRGRDWARWTLTIVTMASLLDTWSLIRFQLGYGVIVGGATVVQILLELLGCLLLFLPASHRWYRRSRTVPAA